MITVIIPTLNAENELGKCLAALVPAAVEGSVRQVVISDGGSADRTREMADDAGADVLEGLSGRGLQLQKGATAARSPWLLFLHADTVLEAGWQDEASRFIEAVDLGERPPSAAAFRFRLADRGIMPRFIEAGVGFRSRNFGLPFGDQGLLISRRLYDEIGGYRPLPLMEDLDIVRRLGPRRIAILETNALTSAARYRRDGYFSRIARNQACLAMYAAGMPIEKIARFYDRNAAAPTAADKDALPEKSCG